MSSPLRPWAAVASAVRGLGELVLPLDCAGCAAPGVSLCPGCAAPLLGDAAAHRPDPAPPGLPPVWAVAAYDGAVRAALVAYKEHGRLGLARPLGAALAVAASAAAAPGDAGGPLLLVPAPTRAEAVRARGQDPMLRLARRAARELRRRDPAVCTLPVLRLARAVSDQAGLGAGERAANLAGAHHVPQRLVPLVSGRPVVLLDDVVTTGATLAEAARALRAAGADVLGAAVVAATARHTGR